MEVLPGAPQRALLCRRQAVSQGSGVLLGVLIFPLASRFGRSGLGTENRLALAVCLGAGVGRGGGGGVPSSFLPASSRAGRRQPGRSL